MSSKRLVVVVMVGLLFVPILQVAVIPTAARAVSEVKAMLVAISPEGNTVKVDSAGGNAVNVQGSINVGNVPTVNAQQSGTWNVGLQGTPTVGIDPGKNTVQLAPEARTPVNVRIAMEMTSGLQNATAYTVGPNKTLVIKTVSAIAPGSGWQFGLYVPATGAGNPWVPLYLSPVTGVLSTTSIESVDVMVPAGGEVKFEFARNASGELPVVSVYGSFTGYLIDAP